MRKFRITTQRAVIEVMAEDEENALNKAKTVSTSVEFFPGVCNIRESKKPGSWGLTDEIGRAHV